LNPNGGDVDVQLESFGFVQESGGLGRKEFPLEMRIESWAALDAISPPFERELIVIHKKWIGLPCCIWSKNGIIDRIVLI